MESQFLSFVFMYISQHTFGLRMMSATEAIRSAEYQQVLLNDLIVLKRDLNEWYPAVYLFQFEL